MDNLIFCLNATIPIFLTLMLGYFLRKINLYDDSFVAQMNKFVFKAALPALLFMNVAESDFIKVWDTKFVLFCFGATFCSIAISIGLSFLLNPRDIQGEFVQASYRSSAAILGIAIIQNLYGDAGMAPLMIIASVPLYNVMAVMVLSFMKPDNQGMNKQMLLKTLKGIASNPIILGILAGLIWSVLRLPLPTILSSTVNNLGKTATPLGLMAMGGALHYAHYIIQCFYSHYLAVHLQKFRIDLMDSATYPCQCQTVSHTTPPGYMAKYPHQSEISDDAADNPYQEFLPEIH